MQKPKEHILGSKKPRSEFWLQLVTKSLIFSWTLNRAQVKKRERGVKFMPFPYIPVMSFLWLSEVTDTENPGFPDGRTPAFGQARTSVPKGQMRTLLGTGSAQEQC